MELNYRGDGVARYNNKEYRCNLYTKSDLGGVLINLYVEEPFASFIELPFEIDYLNCELSNGFKFILHKCSRQKMTNRVCEGNSEYSYIAQYMYEGVEQNNNANTKFSKVVYELSNIIEWGDVSNYKVANDHKLATNNKNKIKIYENDEYSIMYAVIGSFLPVVKSQLMCECIKLEQKCYLEIKSKKEKEIEFFEEIIFKIKNLIEVAILRKVYLKSITGYSNKLYYMVENNKIKLPVNIISKNFYNKNENQNLNSKWKLIALQELLDNNSLEYYFIKHDKLSPIIELYTEIINSNNLSVIRTFLNIVQALETYHSRFITNDIEKFKLRIKNVILKNTCRDEEKFLIANSRRFITLESRLADLLLAEFNICFDTGDIAYHDFPNIIANTRNYYIHYDENLKQKNKVLTTQELILYNRCLISILEYYILLELNFTNVDLIKSKLKERWGSLSETLSIINASKNKDIIN